jgi:putative ABC transport system ATP-binding protein
VRIPPTGGGPGGVAGIARAPLPAGEPLRSASRPVLAVEDLTKGYRGSQALFAGVDLTLAAGDYVAIMGESGVGKSTLLNLIAGLDVPDQGRILLDGDELSGLDEVSRTRLRRRKLGFVFQAFLLLPHLTVEQNVALPLALNGLSDDRRVADLLAAVGIGDKGQRFPRELSGGEMQRVAVARALVHRPLLVLADEPTGNLDPESAGQVLAVLREQLKRDGAAGVLVTHSPGAAATADRVLQLTRAGLGARETL